MTNPDTQQQLNRLLTIMTALRDPETGCEWDIAQDFSTIAPYTIEEAYEVADAIARNDMRDLKEELGDLLLQVVFHAHMAQEQGQFTFADVARAISDKMEARHPHIFPSNARTQPPTQSTTQSPAQAQAHTQPPIQPNAQPHSQNQPQQKQQPQIDGAEAIGEGDIRSDDSERADWEDMKRRERSEKGANSAMDGVALALPALMRADKLQKRAARTGFDWDDTEGPADKLREEIEELRLAVSDTHRHEEAGDVLFAAVNLVRAYGIPAEEVLSAANAKFERRFRAMEVLAAQDAHAMISDVKEVDASAAGEADGLAAESGGKIAGSTDDLEQYFSELPLEQKEALWQRVKKSEIPKN